MKPISFIQIKRFIVNEIKKYSIDDFYLQKHPYFIYNENVEPKIDSEKIISELSREFDFTIILSEQESKYIIPEYFRKVEHIILSEEIKNFKVWLICNLRSIEKHNNSIIDHISSLNSKINELQSSLKQASTDILVPTSALSQNEIEISDTIKVLEEIKISEKEIVNRNKEVDDEISKLSSLKDKEPYKAQIEKLEQAKKQNTSVFQYKLERTNKTLVQLQEKKENLNTKLLKCETKKFDILESIEDAILKRDKYQKENIEFDSSNERIAIDLITSYLFQEKISTGYSPSYSGDEFKNKLSIDLFWEVYSSYELSGVVEWKEQLIEILNKEIALPQIFRIFEDKELHKAKFAQICSTIIEIKKDYNRKDVTEIIEAQIDDVFPIWNSLRSALHFNKIEKSVNNIFYLSLNNGIFAKIAVRRNTGNSDTLIIALKYENRFTTSCDIFIGYTNSGFLLPKGIYLNFKGWVFEIDFDANALLLPGNHYFQQIQSISDEAKGDYEAEQKRLADLDDDDNY